MAAQDADIFDDMRHRLITGEFGYGTKLRAEKLRQDYNCSASTVREVLFRLSTVGLVDFQEQRGFRSPYQSVERQHELTHMRILLETEGACLSIRLGGVEWESRLTAAHHKLSHIETRVRSSGDLIPLLGLWSRAEQEFHETLIDACGSGLLKRTHVVIYEQFRQQLVSAETNYGYFPENIREHQAILDAALQRNEDLMRVCVNDHLARNLTRPLPRKSYPDAFGKSSAI
ncbi:MULTISPECIES: GntR family transcriptional regulator [unclassified Roseobacter]|uniref:GntR family transcriptional regulator n=1 Tax=unclassified Roseobacter TaxID=196798 RepID=UPI0018A324C3|nr:MULTISPECIES: GntR family transcriptional regulator [unclassified Roseobacter]MDW3181414.1 GntR family transcriptional regulator [Roseobacter sp.]